MKLLNHYEWAGVAEEVVRETSAASCDFVEIESLAKRHVANVSGRLAEIATALARDVLESSPLSVASTQNDEKRRRALNLTLALRLLQHFLARNGRVDVIRHDVLPPSLARAAEAYLADGSMSFTGILHEIEDLVVEDRWPQAPAVAGAIGLSAAVAGPWTDLSPAERAKRLIFRQAIEASLRSMGFAVQSACQHMNSHDDVHNCNQDRDLDLLIVDACAGGTRLGHQIAGVSNNLGMMIALLPEELKDVNCTFKDQRIGTANFRVSSSKEAIELISVAVEDNIDRLRLRRRFVDQMAEEEHRELVTLRDKIVELVRNGWSAPLCRLVPRERALHAVESPHNFLATPASIRRLLFQIAEPAPNTTAQDSPVEAALRSLFTDNQLGELDLLVLNGEIARFEVSAILQAAARNRVAVSAGGERRSKRFEMVDDWLHIRQMVRSDANRT